MTLICPIWNEQCSQSCVDNRTNFPSNLSRLARDALVCRRAGMYSYNLSNEEMGEVEQLLYQLNEDAKVCLCAEIAYQNEMHGAAPLLNAAFIRGVETRPMPLMPERLDLALKWLVRHSPSIDSHPLGSLTNWKNTLAFLAFTYCRVGQYEAHQRVSLNAKGEAGLIIRALEQEGLVEVIRPPNRHPHDLFSEYHATRVSHRGYARYQELEGKSADSSQAFVAMWFDSSMDAVYQDAIAPAIEDAGYAPTRVDNVQHNRKIDDEIIALIRRSRFVVADFTAGNPKESRGGVYYEAGFAYGLGREVIHTCRADFVEALHFDTRQYNHIVWSGDDLPQFRKDLRHRIEATIGRGPIRQDEE